MPDRPQVFVHLLPSLIAPGALRGGTAVVVDVLRATTAMVHALGSGLEAIIPCLEVEEAKQVAASLPTGSALLGGERRGLPIEGFDLGNSPSSYTPDVCRGKTLVMTTTNGTRAIHASLEADRVLIGAFPNLCETAEAANEGLGPVHVVCSGTDGEISLEDSYLAGVFVELITDMGREHGNDSARIVESKAMFAGSNFMLGDSTYDLIAKGRGGRRVRQLGLDRDIHDASEFDSIPLVAELRRDPLRIVRV